MPTYENELAGVSPVTEQPLPTKSKYTLDKEKYGARLRRLEVRDIRLLNDNPIIEYKKGELTGTLGNPRDNILRQINQGNYKIITSEESLHTPYRLAS